MQYTDHEESEDEKRRKELFSKRGQWCLRSRLNKTPKINNGSILFKINQFSTYTMNACPLLWKIRKEMDLQREKVRNTFPSSTLVLWKNKQKLTTYYKNFNQQNYRSYQGFYFHDVLEQLKTKFHTNSKSSFLGFVIEYAWISQLLHDGQ